MIWPQADGFFGRRLSVSTSLSHLSYIQTTEQYDTLGFIGVVLLFIVTLTYIRVLRHQYNVVIQKPQNLRIVVLSVRAAFVALGFAICYWVSLVYSYAYTFMLIPEAYIEAYCIFAFFALTNVYVGGPEKVVDVIRTSKRTFPSRIFADSMRLNPDGFYRGIYNAHWQLFFIRPILVMVSVILYYANAYYATKTGQGNTAHTCLVLSMIINALSALLVIVAVTALVKNYHILYPHCSGLNATWKIIIIKLTVGLVVSEGLIESILYSVGAININGELQTLAGNNKYDEANRDIRWYCFGILVQLMVISIVMVFAFAVDIDTSKAGAVPSIASSSPSSSSPSSSPSSTPSQPSHIADEDSDKLPTPPAHLSFCRFLLLVLRVHDIFAPVKLPKREVGRKLTLGMMNSPFNPTDEMRGSEHMFTRSNSEVL